MLLLRCPLLKKILTFRNYGFCFDGSKMAFKRLFAYLNDFPSTPLCKKFPSHMTFLNKLVGTEPMWLIEKITKGHIPFFQNCVYQLIFSLTCPSHAISCSNLDEVKLKEKGRAFHDSFLTKVGTTLFFKNTFFHGFEQFLFTASHYVGFLYYKHVLTNSSFSNIICWWQNHSYVSYLCYWKARWWHLLTNSVRYSHVCSSTNDLIFPFDINCLSTEKSLHIVPLGIKFIRNRCLQEKHYKTNELTGEHSTGLTASNFRTRWCL